MANIKKYLDRLFIDGQLVTKDNIDSYINKTKETLSVLESYKQEITNRKSLVE